MKNLIKKPLIKIACINEKHDEIYVHVCPACWNSKTGRAFLTAKLKNINITPIYKKDSLNGEYKKKHEHIFLCPYENVFN